MNWLVDADVTEPLIVSQVQVSASTGDTQFDISIRGQRYRVHKWVRPNNVYTSGADYVVGTITFSTGGEIEVLCVGGGGRGGTVPTTGSLGSFGSYASGGGGGGGGVVQSKITVGAGNAQIAAGWGGSASFSAAPHFYKWSVFEPLGAALIDGVVIGKGGGDGGSVDLTASPPITDGAGSSDTSTFYGGGGGGAALKSNTAGDQVSDGGGSNLGEGTDGADGVLVSAVAFDDPLSGGGGGASESGRIATNELPNGGNGIVSSITGTPLFYGGGGAGGCRQISPLFFGVEPALGGLGGGGGNIAGSESGQNDFGGGGVGGLIGQTSFGLTAKAGPGNGGTGVVIIRYPIEG